MGRGLAKEDVERFAREDKKVRGHLDIIRRKELLEAVLAKMKTLNILEESERREGHREAVGAGKGLGTGNNRKRSWTIV